LLGAGLKMKILYPDVPSAIIFSYYPENYDCALSPDGAWTAASRIFLMSSIIISIAITIPRLPCPCNVLTIRTGKIMISALASTWRHTENASIDEVFYRSKETKNE